MCKVLKHDKRVLLVINRLLRRNFNVSCNPGELNDFCLLNDSWLGKVIQDVTVSDLLNFFRNYFDVVQFYHGCGPKNLKPYYVEGIDKLNISRIETQLTYLLRNEISQEEQDLLKVGFKEARAFIEDMYGRDRICLHTDKRQAIEASKFSHIGGEYISYIVSKMPSSPLKCKISHFLANKNIPTLLIVHIPLVDLTNKDLISFLNHLICIWVEIYVLKRFEFQECSYNTISYNSQIAIKPIYIYRHEHPRVWLKDRAPFYCDICHRTISHAL